MPRAKKIARDAVCANCGASFKTTRDDARFCPPPEGARVSPCQTALATRNAARGKVLAPYVLAWLDGRGGGWAGTNPIAAKALSELTAIGRTFIEEDREAGRPSLIPYVESIFAEGFLYCDRRRPNRSAKAVVAAA